MHLPAALAPVVRLAFNLRWVWSHATDRLWETLNAEVWLQTRNPILVLQNTPRSRFDELAHDPEFVERVRRLDRQEAEYLSRPGWFQQAYEIEPPPLTAYFSMEYGITDALPLYSGGLGVLAGDHLKTASDLGVPLVAVGLLYREGYFRQMLDAQGRQLEIYAVNSSESLPVQLVNDAEGTPLRVTLAYTDVPGFPGATRALVNDLDLEVIGPDGRRGMIKEDGATPLADLAPHADVPESDGLERPKEIREFSWRLKRRALHDWIIRTSR